MSDTKRHFPQPAADPAPRHYVLDDRPIEVPRLTPGLHIVATPIGNLGDITLRALDALAGADVIACEDTRVTRKLLDRYGIETRLTPYHDHNATKARPALLRRLAAGEAVALVSDAGTPLISDPGFKLVREACAAGHRFVSNARVPIGDRRPAISSGPSREPLRKCADMATLQAKRYRHDFCYPTRERRG